MKNTLKKKTVPSAEAIARRADQGEDVSGFFTGKGRMMAPVQRVNVDFAVPMLAELDEAAQALNVSRQALIKTMLRQALDRHYMARNAGNGLRREL